MQQVSIKLFERQAIADKATNFEHTLPSAGDIEKRIKGKYEVEE